MELERHPTISPQGAPYVFVGLNYAHILQNEIWTTPADGHNTSGQYNPAVHSTSGINSVSLNGYPSDLDSRVIKTTQEMDEFPYNLDMNSGEQLGIGT